MKPLILFILPVAIVFFNSSRAHAEGNDHTSTQTSSTAAANSRAAQDKPLTNREMDFIANNFFISKKTIWTKYSEKLPRALESAIKDKNETESGQVVAELMGMINGEQAKRALDNAIKERDSEKAKKPSGGDERYIALMERFVWGTKAFLKTPSKEEAAEKYNEQFDEAFKSVALKNQEIREKIKQAADGNEQAKDWLRKNLDQSSLLSFAEGQKKFGNTELADRLIDAVSFKEGKNKFLDMSTANETQRLHLGQTSKSVSQAVDKLFEAKKGFNGAVASFSPFTTSPMKQWYVDGTGKFQVGAPKTFSSVTSSSPASSSQQSAKVQSLATQNNSSSFGKTTSNAVSSTSNQATSARATLLSSCRDCHDQATIDPNGVFYKKPGAPRTKEAMIKALDSVPAMVDNFDDNQRATLKALIQQWIQ